MSLGKRTLLLVVILLSVCFTIPGSVLPDDVLQLYGQAELARRSGNWKTAVRLYTEFLNAKPKFFVAYHNRAIAYSKMGEYDKSIADLKKAIELNGKYPDAHGLLGLVYEIKKNYPAALASYNKALSLEKRPKAKQAIQAWIDELNSKAKRK